MNLKVDFIFKFDVLSQIQKTNAQEEEPSICGFYFTEQHKLSN